MVAVRSRVFATDEELAKRDDDHKPPKMSNWNIKTKPAWRKRRIAIAIIACFGVWLFIHYMPTDLGPVDRQTGRRIRVPVSRARPPTEPSKAWDVPSSQTIPETSKPDEPVRSLPHDYDGPVRFYYLASTLRAAEKATDADVRDRDVLFAASNLKNAGVIIPIACEMARWKRNTVHVAIMGRSEISMEEIKQINGAPTESCNIWWHDARPDFVKTSTDDRMEVSVAGAIGHINSFLRPVVVITTELDHEDTFFAHGAKRKLRQQLITNIQVPKSDPESLSWLARLDSASLKAWHTASIDLLVQAPLDSSGSLIRLLKSLSAADYSGFTPPKLTIELPHTIDTITSKFLSRFRWPPVRYAIPGQNDQLTIRRRIFEQKMSVEEASQRFIESFYPAGPNGPHVLVLSPRTELSPVYFHYAKLHVLEYRHSSSISEVERSLFGVSLEAPSAHLDGITPFKPQLTTTSDSDANNGNQITPFRWQAPNTNAALYFGDKWMELHSFLLRRHSAARHPSLKSYYANEKKVVTPKSPAWAEYMLQLMQNRGYFLHYPGIKLLSSLAIVHNELYQVPEEFAQVDDESAPTDAAPSTESILIVKDEYLESHHPSAAKQKLLNRESQFVQNIDSILPQAHPPQDTKENVLESTPGDINSESRRSAYQSAISRLSNLPLLDSSGENTRYQKLQTNAEASRLAFRTSAGACTAEQSRKLEAVAFSAEDLFCFDMRESDWANLSPPSTKGMRRFSLLGDNNDEATDPDNEYDNNDLEDGEGEDHGGNDLNNGAHGKGSLKMTVLDAPAKALGAEQPPGDFNGFVGGGLESMKDFKPAAEISSSDGPPARDAKTDRPAPATDGKIPENADRQGDGDAAKDSSGPMFPVLDGSKIKAFDEGREAEREVLEPSPGKETQSENG